MKESMSFHTATSVLEIEKLLTLNKMKIVIEEQFSAKRPVSNTNFYSFSESQNQISISWGSFPGFEVWTHNFLG